ncbi:hypothetical protein FRX31_004325 [Thalictrum thalictroides]|uniref:Protein kinase domain-containing protein n=1 Tax=Thalictrum thalictroides TaxID=46969 RepID=A0A7J6XAR9_THATH|nr:hypothetical protein FRX31_004325 [Thalictrum thalictroides]
MEIDPDPNNIESYTIEDNLISISPHIEVKKAIYTLNPPALGVNHEPQTFTVVIKAINTSQLVYQEPPSVDNPNVLHHSHWQKESTHCVVAAYSKLGSVNDILKSVHRDIKPSSILINKQRNPTIKVSASYYQPNHTSLTTAESTENAPYWLPPEHRTPTYSSCFSDFPDQLIKSDIWSLGVLAMELAYGGPPISAMTADNSKAVFERLGSHLNFRNHKKRASVSAKLKNFVSGCLTTDPDQRLTVNDLLNHDFLNADNVSSAEDFIQDIESEGYIGGCSGRADTGRGTGGGGSSTEIMMV